MDYEKKTREIEEAVWEVFNIPYQFPLLNELLARRTRARKEYFARINYNLMVYGKSPLQFDDINYKP